MGVLRVQLRCKSGLLAAGEQIGGVRVFAKAELQEGSDTAHSLLSLTELYKYCQVVYFGSFFKWGKSF